MPDRDDRQNLDHAWHDILTTGREHKDIGRYRRLVRHVPSDPRCRICYVPFKGIGGALMRMLGTAPSTYNPTVCNDCERFARKHPGGAQVELAMLFADIRGSTGMAERLGDAAFRALIDRFYRVATDILVDSDAWIEKLAGDEVSALYVPGFAGPGYTAKAIQAARALLAATRRERIPTGIGVHKGVAFVGSVGSRGGMVEFTALGDAVNAAARLASVAAAGELLVSDEALEHEAVAADGLERRVLRLKGRSAPVSVRVLH